MSVKAYKEAKEELVKLQKKADLSKDETLKVMYWEGFIEGYERRYLDSCQSNQIYDIGRYTANFLASVHEYAKNMDSLIQAANQEIQADTLFDKQ